MDARKPLGRGQGGVAAGSCLAVTPPAGCVQVGCNDLSQCLVSCSTTQRWVNARMLCENAGWRLNCVDSNTEADCLGPLADLAWIGHQQDPMATEPGTGWARTDGSIPAPLWGNGEPGDGVTTAEDHEEDCAFLFSNGKWGDWICDSAAALLPYTCEL